MKNDTLLFPSKLSTIRIILGADNNQSSISPNHTRRNILDRHSTNFHGELATPFLIQTPENRRINRVDNPGVFHGAECDDINIFQRRTSGERGSAARNPSALKSARQPSRKMNSQLRGERGVFAADGTLSSGKLYLYRCVARISSRDGIRRVVFPRPRMSLKSGRFSSGLATQPWDVWR